jgi:hypothetical protein
MTPRTPQWEVFWTLLSNSKHSGVPEDSKSPTLEVLGFTPTLGQSGVATLVMRISIHFHVWWGKKWETSFCMWTPLFNTITIMVFQSVSWVAMHSLLHRLHNKWIFKSLMIWPHRHRERCAIVGCGILRWIRSVIRKWGEDKWNDGVFKWANN